jgi:hypothetical protein
VMAFSLLTVHLWEPSSRFCRDQRDTPVLNDKKFEVHPPWYLRVLPIEKEKWGVKCYSHP